MSYKAIIALVVIAFAVLVPVGCTVSSYNTLVTLDEGVESQWAQVQNAYQRRLDLVPNLVETVKGAAKFEKETYTGVAEARARAAQATNVNAPDDPAALQKFEQAQQQLSSALSRLMVVVERYPELKATDAFRDLMAQLEGTENRIAVERMRFNEAARGFNTKRNSFPTMFVASLFGSRFAEKGYFHAEAGAEKAPKVSF
ncbi:MAG TPA: LemA family protein [Polyangiaceae bacterium]|jgi:LemA protein|nr:LemA family protein [Polyangiaceae bacterium]